MRTPLSAGDRLMAVWPNGLNTRPKLSSLWKQYEGVYAKDHYGLDMYGFMYNCAIDDGEIIRIGYNLFGGGGHEVYLRLDNGDVILYYHNAPGLLVKVGDRVTAGQRLGIQSDSGKTDGIHLHLEVWLDGYRSRRVDPLPYITKLVGASPANTSTTPLIDSAESENEMKSIRLRDSQNGSIAWANWETGLFWELPNLEYEALLSGWDLWDRTQDKEVPTNVYLMLKSVAASVRGSVDSAAIAKLILADLPTGGNVDEVALVARFESALADNFAGIPADVLAALKGAL